MQDKFVVLSKPNYPALALIAAAHFMLISTSWGPSGAKQAGPSTAALQVALLPAPVQEVAVPAQADPVPEPPAEPLAPVQHSASVRPSLPAQLPAAERPTGLVGSANYYPASALTDMPEPDGIFELPVPEGERLSGQVEVRLWIDAQGKLDRVAVLSSLMPELYQQAAMSAFRKLRYRPGRIREIPVAAFVDIVVEFSDEPLPPVELPYEAVD